MNLRREVRFQGSRFEYCNTYIDTQSFIIMKFFFMFLFLQIIVANVHAQLRYPIVGNYKGRGAQGMAIYGDNAFLMSDGGLCRVYNLASKKQEREFALASSSPKNHVNNVCFGPDHYKGNVLPLIYVSECNNPFRCFVENITADSCELIQTIEVKNHEVIIDWVVDCKSRKLYSISRTGEVIDDAGNCVCNIKKYRLPSVNEGNSVVLSEQDVIDQFSVIFPNILQGCKIRNNMMYLVTGFQESLSHRVDACRSLKVIDLKLKRLRKESDLTYITTNEPEDIDFYKGYCLMYCGQEGGLYEINYR